MTLIGGQVATTRDLLARKYAIGSGLEIGALDAPYPVDKSVAAVKYVDRLSKADLLRHYPELLDRAQYIGEPDIIDDGEQLSLIKDNSQDFLIASHFLEHCENPLKTLRSHHRVLRPGGHLLLAVPNTANPESADHRRPLTTFAHLVRDDAEGPHVSRDEHYWEWVIFAGNMSDDAAAREQAKLMAMRYSIHFHCWTASTFHDFLRRAFIHSKIAFEVAEEHENSYEIAVVLRKTAIVRGIMSSAPETTFTSTDNAWN